MHSRLWLILYLFFFEVYLALFLPYFEFTVVFLVLHLSPLVYSSLHLFQAAFLHPPLLFSVPILVSCFRAFAFTPLIFLALSKPFIQWFGVHFQFTTSTALGHFAFY